MLWPQRAVSSMRRLPRGRRAPRRQGFTLLSGLSAGLNLLLHASLGIAFSSSFPSDSIFSFLHFQFFFVRVRCFLFLLLAFVSSVFVSLSVSSVPSSSLFSFLLFSFFVLLLMLFIFFVFLLLLHMIIFVKMINYIYDIYSRK